MAVFTRGVRLLEQDMPNWSNYKVKQGQVIMVMGTPSGKEIKAPEVATKARAPRAPRRRSSAVPGPAIRCLCVTVPPPRHPARACSDKQGPVCAAASQFVEDMDGVGDHRNPRWSDGQMVQEEAPDAVLEQPRRQ